MISIVRRVIPPYFCIMKTVFNGIMKNKWTKLAALAIAALWSGPTVQAQAPHPERIYLSGTGIDNTKTWEFFCSGGQNSGKWKKIEVPCNWELQGFGEYTYGRWYTIKVKGQATKRVFTDINLNLRQQLPVSG